MATAPKKHKGLVPKLVEITTDPIKGEVRDMENILADIQAAQALAAEAQQLIAFAESLKSNPQAQAIATDVGLLIGHANAVKSLLSQVEADVETLYKAASPELTAAIAKFKAGLKL